jgi:hypothetical protein
VHRKKAFADRIVVGSKRNSNRWGRISAPHVYLRDIREQCFSRLLSDVLKRL